MKSKKPQFPPRIVDPRSTPFAPISFRGTLPHIFKDGCTYFVTFCLADVSAARRAERRHHSDAREASALAMGSEPHTSSGECIFKNPELAKVVENTLVYEQGQRYLMSAWCVMPNHVHAVVTPLESHVLSKIIQTWKSVSAHRINKILDRTGPVWQREWFDHLVRDEASFEKFVAYTENNPVAAGFVDMAEKWRFSSARFLEAD